MRYDCAAVLFDSDGTAMCDSRLVLFLRLDGVREAMGCRPRRAYADGAAHHPSDIVAHFLPEQHRSEAVAAVRRHELTDVDGLVPIPGAAELLAGLDGGRWAVVTSGRRDLLELRLTTTGLPAPGVVVTAEDVAQGKPDPAGFTLAAKRLGVDPADCIVVEDAPSGIAAGRASGARVLGVATTHSADALDADVVVPDLRSVSATVADSRIYLSL